MNACKCQIQAFCPNDQKTAEVYLYLLKQAKIPHRFNIEKRYNQKQKRNTPEAFAITISCKSYELSIYLKYPQLQIKHAQGYLDDQQELNNALGQLRIELREAIKRNVIVQSQNY